MVSFDTVSVPPPVPLPPSDDEEGEGEKKEKKEEPVNKVVLTPETIPSLTQVQAGGQYYSNIKFCHFLIINSECFTPLILVKIHLLYSFTYIIYNIHIIFYKNCERKN